MRTPPIGSARGGFTLIELLTVITIIMVLVGMIIGISSLVQQKQARAGAEAQIQALSTAIESYKVDNAIVPRNTTTDGFQVKNGTGYHSGALNPTAGSFAAASLYLYKQLSGDDNADRKRDLSNATEKEMKAYFTFKPSMLAPTTGSGTVTAIVDPFGYTYGYSTAANKEIEDGATPTKGFNPTFDLWSTGGAKVAADTGKWIKNW